MAELQPQRDKRYSEEDAREILKRASSLQTQTSDFTESQLQEMAEELGISEAALVQAKQSWLAEQEKSVEQRVFEEDRAAYDRHRRREFMSHLTVFIIVNTFLFLINLFSTGFDPIWFMWPLMGWGIGLAIHASTTFLIEDEDYEKNFIEWRTKRHIEQDTRRRLSS